ncbi:hypothetical protein [Roseovarius sp. SYSU LYC5161]
MLQVTQKPDFAQIAHCYRSPDAMRAWQQRGGMLGRNPVEGVPC